MERLAAEREHLHPLPAQPHKAALGEERLVNDDQTIRFGSVRYSTHPDPPPAANPAEPALEGGYLALMRAGSLAGRS